MSIVSHLKPNIEFLAEIRTDLKSPDVVEVINKAMRAFTAASKGLDGGVVESVRLIGYKAQTDSVTIRIRWRSNNRGLWKKLKRADDRFAMVPPLADYDAPHDEPLTGDEPFTPPATTPSAAETSNATPSPYSGLKYKQLKKMATDQGIDVSGIKGKGASKQIIEKLIAKEQQNGGTTS